MKYLTFIPYIHIHIHVLSQILQQGKLGYIYPSKQKPMSRANSIQQYTQLHNNPKYRPSCIDDKIVNKLFVLTS